MRIEKGATALEPNEIRGMDAEEILNDFYGQVAFTRGPKGWSRPVRSRCASAASSCRSR